MAALRHALGGDLRAEVRGEVLRVWHRRPARDLTEARAVLAMLDELVVQHRVGLMLFDSREADTAPPDVQSAIWRWLTSKQLVGVATLVRSELLAISVKMQGVSRGLKIRAFADEREALAWLASL